MSFSLKPSTDEIEQAIQGLRSAVNRLIQRAEQRQQQQKQNVIALRKRRIEKILKHMHHCLLHLSVKREALQIGFQVLCDRIWPELLQRLRQFKIANNNNNNTQSNNNHQPKQQQHQQLFRQSLQSLLQHFFIQLLRFHDGLILVISGECRHPGDTAQAQLTSFPSQLVRCVEEADAERDSSNSGGAFRSDGYTQLYSPDKVYSGHGWDEIANETNGLQQRLMMELEPFLPPSLQAKNKNYTSSNGTWNWFVDKYESSVQDFENVLDRVEGQIRGVDFKSFANRMRHDLTTVLQQQINGCGGGGGGGPSLVKVEVNLGCKMESLKITLFGGGDFNSNSAASTNSTATSTWNCILKRLGSNFRLDGSGGVLPPLSTKEWIEALKLPESARTQQPTSLGGSEASTKKKRRLVIEDSDDDDDDVQCEKGRGDSHKRMNLSSQVKHVNIVTTDRKQESSAQSVTPVTAAGLVVRVREIPRSSQDVSVAAASRESGDGDETQTTSLNYIKQQMGVDLMALSAARDTIEAEEAGASQEAAHIDFAAVSDDYDGNHIDGQHHQRLSMEEAARAVKRSNRSLRKELLREDMNDLDVWDAREKLREGLMKAGNACLWSNNEKEKAGGGYQGHESKKTLLKQAVEYFVDARRHVQDQELLFMRISKTLTTADLFYYRRNLKLFLGRACVNAGIAKVELGRLETAGEKERKMYLRKGIVDLDNAINFANAMAELAERDKKNGESPIETNADLMKARELKALSLRWKGSSLWHQGLRNESVSSYDTASSLLDGTAISDLESDDLVIEATTKAMIECFFSTTTLADTIMITLQDASVQSIRDGTTKYDGLVDIVSKALEKAASLRNRLENYLGDTCHGLLCEHGVAESTEINETIATFKTWWQQRKATSLQRIDTSPARNTNIPRGDLLGVGESMIDMPLPTARLTLDTMVKRSRRKQFGAGYSNVGPSHNTPQLQSQPQSSQGSKERKHRRWGDELLPQRIDEQGSSVPILTYPSIAPEMPPEIKAIFDSIKRI